MLFDTPLHLSRSLISGFGTKAFLHHSERVPVTNTILVVSNYRSFLDALLLMAGSPATGNGCANGSLSY